MSLEESRAERRRRMLEDPILKILPVLAIPMIIAMLIDSLYNLADTYFVSQLGKAATAAVGVNDSLMMFMRSIAMGFGMGASSYISRLMGAKKEDEADRVAITTLLTSMAALIVFAVICFIFLDPLATLLGATESSKPFTMQYASFIFISAPFTAGEVCLSQLLRSEGSTKYSMIGMVSGCILNVGLDPLCISVFGWGIAGAAIATSFSKLVSFCILLSPFLAKKTMLVLKFKNFTPKARIYKEVARMGIPNFLRSSMMSVSSIITNNIAGGFGDSALAAVSVANKCTRLVGSAIIGFGQGFQPLSGYCWGAKKYKRVRKAFWQTSAVGAVFSIVLGAIMAIFAGTIVSAFASKDTDIIEIGSLMIRTQCYTMVFHTWVMICNSLFQSIGRGLPATILGLSRQVICLIPLVLILPHFFGIYGLCWSQAGADVLSMFIAIPMMLKISKELKILGEEEERLQMQNIDPLAEPIEEP